jgi:hypothetical protein
MLEPPGDAQELPRSQTGMKLGHEVQVLPLPGWPTHRIGLIHGRDREEIGQRSDGIRQPLTSIPKVRDQPQ